MAFFVKFWGVRGSIPTPGFQTARYGGNTSCVELRVDGELLICDGGTGLRELGLDLMKRRLPQIVGHMFFSHAHWDHIQGFPFFLPAYQPTSTFRVYDAVKTNAQFYQLLSGQMRSDYFPVEFSELRSSILADDLESCGGEVAGVKVKAYRLHHPGNSWAYSFERGGRKVVYATDHELDQTLLNKEAVHSDLSAPRAVPREFVDFLRGADLYIADGQYTEQEYSEKVGWGHARCTTPVDAAALAGVSQLALYHYDPMHTDQDVEDMLAICRQRAKRLGAPVQIFGAREGMELKLE